MMEKVTAEEALLQKAFESVDMIDQEGNAVTSRDPEGNTRVAQSQRYIMEFYHAPENNQDEDWRDISALDKPQLDIVHQILSLVNNRELIPHPEFGTPIPYTSPEEQEAIDRLSQESVRLQSEQRAKMLEWWVRFQNTTKPAPLPTKGRPGRRLGIKPPSTILLPVSNHTASPTMLMGKGEWGQGRDNGIISESTRSKAIIGIQSETPDKAEWALNHMNKQSPAVQQAFLGLIALWFHEIPSGASSDTYYTCKVTDLLRFMGKSQRAGGSYDSEAVLKMGEHIKVIQGLIVHRAIKNTYIRAKKGTITEKTEMSYIPISIETIETKTETDANGNLVSEPSIEFSFHPSKEIYEAIRGSEKQFISTLPALLKYHPVRQKYHVSLGIALLTYQRMNQKNRGNEEISLSALLGLAEIQIPDRNLPRFLGRKRSEETQWESEGILGAIDDLINNGVVKDVQIVDCTATSARQRLEKITLKTKSKHLK